MEEFQDMQKYIAQCAGGEWTDNGCWRYERSMVQASSQQGLESFLKMQSTDDDLGLEELQEVSASLTWLVARPPFEGGLEGVAIRTHIREFARDCKEDART